MTFTSVRWQLRTTFPIVGKILIVIKAGSYLIVGRAAASLAGCQAEPGHLGLARGRHNSSSSMKICFKSNPQVENFSLLVDLF